MPVTTWDTEEWSEAAWIYALNQNTQISTLGITTYTRNPTITDELPYPHIQVECVSVYPASKILQDKTEIAEVEITVRTSKATDLIDSGSFFRTQRKLLFQLCGAIRAVIYADYDDLKSWLETGGDARYMDALNIVNVSNPRYQAERINCVDNSTQDYHIRTFTVSISVEPHPDYA